jgi:N-acetylmuramoyl-L-alanine amidase
VNLKPITVTAGHSPDSPGAERQGLKEHILMTELRDIVIAKLSAQGLPVRGDGPRGINQPLARAMDLIIGSSVAVELHTNAFPDQVAKGVEVVALPKQKALAQQLASAIAAVLDEPLRGDKGFIDQASTARGRLGFVQRGGLIVEVFFLSNPDALAKYQARYWRVASAIADVLAAHVRAGL